jgi:CelD/BcsL family acetyltransferase involved in cellulose biosynthesis
MGYELELTSRHEGPDPATLRRLIELERRREPVHHALAAAMDDLRALSHSLADPAVVAVAQLRLAAARRATRALAEEYERLEAEAMLRDIWR